MLQTFHNPVPSIRSMGAAREPKTKGIGFDSNALNVRRYN